MSCKRDKHEEAMSKELLNLILKEIKNSEEFDRDSIAIDSSDSENEITMHEPIKKSSETITPISKISDSNFYRNNWYKNHNQNKFSTPGEIKAMVQSVGYQNSMLTTKSVYAKENIKSFEYPRNNKRNKGSKTPDLEDVIYKLDKCSGKVKKENKNIFSAAETLKKLTQALKNKNYQPSKTENRTNLTFSQEKRVENQQQEKPSTFKMTQPFKNYNKNVLKNVCRPEKGDSMLNPAPQEKVQPCIVVSLKEVLENFREKADKQTQTNVAPRKLSKACAAESSEMRLSLKNNMLFPTAKTKIMEGEKKLSKRKCKKNIHQPAGLASVIWSFVTGISMTNILYEDKPLSVCSSRNK